MYNFIQFSMVTAKGAHGTIHASELDAVVSIALQPAPYRFFRKKERRIGQDSVGAGIVPSLTPDAAAEIFEKTLSELRLSSVEGATTFVFVAATLSEVVAHIAGDSVLGAVTNKGRVILLHDPKKHTAIQKKEGVTREVLTAYLSPQDGPNTSTQTDDQKLRTGWAQLEKICCRRSFFSWSRESVIGLMALTDGLSTHGSKKEIEKHLTRSMRGLSLGKPQFAPRFLSAAACGLDDRSLVVLQRPKQEKETCIGVVADGISGTPFSWKITHQLVRRLKKNIQKSAPLTDADQKIEKKTYELRLTEKEILSKICLENSIKTYLYVGFALGAAAIITGIWGFTHQPKDVQKGSFVSAPYEAARPIPNKEINQVGPPAPP